MDYSNHRCPVCENPFDKDSEIVVCPDCGAPHHRECYEKLNHCYYKDKHSENFDFKTETENKQNTQNATDSTHHANHKKRNSDIIACKNCGTFNVASNSVCNNCGAPLEKEQDYNPYNRHTYERNTPPYHNSTGNPQQPFAGFAFDPMGGLKADEDMGSGVTAEDVKKFTKNNTPFFCRLFHQIKNFGKSRLSIVGLLFHGGWLLYRKMYKLGFFITALMAILITSQLFIATFYADLMSNFTKAMEGVSYTSMFDAIGSFYKTLDAEDQIIMAVYAFSGIGQLLLRVICALCGNRWYYKHCIKHISEIKQINAGSKVDTESAMQAKGGVNGALAISLLITYSVLNFLPYFF